MLAPARLNESTVLPESANGILKSGDMEDHWGWRQTLSWKVGFRRAQAGRAYKCPWWADEQVFALAFLSPMRARRAPYRFLDPDGLAREPLIALYSAGFSASGNCAASNPVTSGGFHAPLCQIIGGQSNGWHSFVFFCVEPMAIKFAARGGFDQRPEPIENFESGIQITDIRWIELRQSFVADKHTHWLNRPSALYAHPNADRSRVAVR